MGCNLEGRRCRTKVKWDGERRLILMGGTFEEEPGQGRERLGTCKMAFQSLAWSGLQILVLDLAG